mmetsp:Transcript_43188/g.91790  ORF Transcript_43188/g.91790 Transcript_43188/m.91790 type:complete len:379 (-) Transcript_43188:288-1424(-)
MAATAPAQQRPNATRTSRKPPCGKCSGSGRRGLLGPKGLGLVSRDCRLCDGSGKAKQPPAQVDRSWATEFEEVRQLGEGSFGRVLEVRALQQTERVTVGEHYAMKLLDRRRYQDEGLHKYLKTEHAVLRTLDHPFLISLVHAFSTQKYHVLVMEFAPGGSLGDKLTKQPVDTPGLPEEDVVRYCSDIIVGTKFLHDHSIIFRDLKPDNVVLSSTDRCKLTDFGLAKNNHDDRAGATSVVGSIGYAAPEILVRRRERTAAPYTSAVDWYSLGVSVYVLLTGGVRNRDAKIQNAPPRNHEILLKDVERNRAMVSATAHAFIVQLVDQDPKNRGEFDMIKRHDFLKATNWETILPDHPRRVGSRRALGTQEKQGEQAEPEA